MGQRHRACRSHFQSFEPMSVREGRVSCRYVSWLRRLVKLDKRSFNQLDTRRTVLHRQAFCTHTSTRRIRHVNAVSWHRDILPWEYGRPVSQVGVHSTYESREDLCIAALEPPRNEIAS